VRCRKCKDLIPESSAVFFTVDGNPTKRGACKKCYEDLVRSASRNAANAGVDRWLYKIQHEPGYAEKEYTGD